MNYNACNGIVYVIKPGDSIYLISQRYGIPMAKILKVNPYLNIHNLRIGDKICIPTGGNLSDEQRVESSDYYMVGENESIKDVMNKTNMKFAELATMNPLDTLMLKPGLKLAVKGKMKDDMA